MTARKMFGRRGHVMLGAVALTAILAIPQATAQPYPNRPIKIVQPSTPGSPTDVLARLTAQHLAVALKQSVIVDDRPGGGGTIGTKAVVTAPADGYTLLFTEGGKHLMTSALYKNPGYDAVKDLTPVAVVGGGSFVMVVAPAVPAKTVREFADHAKANPGKIQFGFGQGTIPHMLGESFKAISGADIASIPYKGGSQAVTDMLGGHIHLNFGTTATLLPLIQQGRLRALAVTGATRSPDLPDVPTMAEAGYPDLAITFWMGLWAPPGTPAEIVETLNAGVNRSLTSPEMVAAMAKAGFDVRGGAAADFAAQIVRESPTWIALAKTAGIKAD
jgi:tripartite-type tricarboxylate transporter receptor subunit TctC